MRHPIDILFLTTTMFKFDFDIDDLDEEQVDFEIPQMTHESSSTIATSQQPFIEISLEDLVRSFACLQSPLVSQLIDRLPVLLLKYLIPTSLSLLLREQDHLQKN